MTMNLLLNFAELAVIQILMYYFEAAFKRGLPGKWCYPAVFLLYGMLLYYVIYQSGKYRAGALMTVAGMCDGRLFSVYNRQSADFLYLCVCGNFDSVSGIVIYGLGSMRTGNLFITYREANVMILFKIAAEILVTKSFVWVANRRKTSSLTKIQYLIFLIVPAFSVVYLYSICLFSGVYVQLYGMELVVINIGMLLVMNGFMTYLLAKILKTNSLQGELDLANQKRRYAVSIL